MALTPLAIAFAALVALAGIAHQWTVDTLPWWQLGAATLILGLLWEWWRVRRYRLSASTSAKPLRLGRRETLTIAFVNEEPGALRIEFTPHLPAEINASTAARSVRVPECAEHSVTVEAQAVALGKLPWRTLPVRVRGPLGLAWWRKPQALDAELLVLPDALSGTTLLGNAPTGVGRRAAPGGGGQELDRLRGYLPGDARHTVDWKATAKTSMLTTRVMREDQHLAVMLVVDAGRTSRTRIDGMSQLGHFVNVTARFAQYAVANDDQVGLVVVADEPTAVLAPARGATAVARLHAALAETTSKPQETDLVAAALAVKRVVRHRSLVVLLTDLYGQSASGRLMQSIRLWRPKHLPMVAGLIAEDVDRLASARAEHWLDPYVALAATDYRRGLEAAASGLRRLGAYPLITRAATLEARLLTQYQLLRQQRRV